MVIPDRRRVNRPRSGYGSVMDIEPEHTPQDESQEHPVQDAHGGSMAPGLVDDTGHQVADVPEQADTEPGTAVDR